MKRCLHFKCKFLANLGWRLLIVAVLSVKVSANASALSPHDVWNQQHFTSNQLANDSISGDLADPDKDGLCNLLEYAFNTDPWVFNSGQEHRLQRPSVRMKLLTNLEKSLHEN
jgi:hypothetical protein